MTENSADSADGIQHATAIVHSFVEKHREDEWQGVVGAENQISKWKIEFKTSDSKITQSATVEKESRNIVEVELGS